MNKKVLLLVDLDGVLFRYDEADDLCDLPDGYFCGLSLESNLLEALRLLKRDGISVRVCGKYPTETSLLEKLHALKEKAPDLLEDAIFIHKSGSKWQTATELRWDNDSIEFWDVFMLDDYSDNLIPFGNCGIKWLNGTNGNWDGNTHKSDWEGYCVSFLTKPTLLAEQLRHICLG